MTFWHISSGRGALFVARVFGHGRYKRADTEGRTLVQSALASAADLRLENNELRVTLALLSSGHRSRAVAALCNELNAAGVHFPGTRLRPRDVIAAPP